MKEYGAADSKVRAKFWQSPLILFQRLDDTVGQEAFELCKIQGVSNSRSKYPEIAELGGTWLSHL